MRSADRGPVDVFEPVGEPRRAEHQPRRGVGVRRDDISAGRDVVPMDGFERAEVIDRDRSAPSLRTHLHAAPFELRTGPAVKNDNAAAPQPSLNFRITHPQPGPASPSCITRVRRTASPERLDQSEMVRFQGMQSAGPR